MSGRIVRDGRPAPHHNERWSSGGSRVLARPG
eukprot:CAMPEP_0184717274 /NCGR_PEP_ID=MMETSP0314-20130426/6797_1 /TAXON_ID=38298 /ORGANISM="Rhodella maculata, Strain CCMP 736" /LENGTH=31 /DNA_ID= /DNA_START= /DNA_END= /DNA_ORIENTATION=